MKPNVNQKTFHIIFVGAQAPVFSRTYIGQTKFQSGNYLGPLKILTDLKGLALWCKVLHCKPVQHFFILTWLG